jgi:hypothetical protein
MSGYVRAGITGAITVWLAVLLYGIVSPERPAPNGTARSPAEPVFFHDAELVDHLAGLQLAAKIERVGWHYSVLSVDLSIRAGMGPDAVFRDLAALARFCFDGTKNVRHLLVRVTGDGELLLGMNGSREQWAKITAQPEDTAGWMRQLEAHFAVKYTKAWEERAARSRS